MNNPAPLGPITVLITTYNAMPYLPRAVNSILCQSYPELEVLLVDDGSTDDTATYLDTLTDSRIRVIHAPHRGRTAALNTGLEEARHPWLAIMDADDLALPERLEVEAGFLAEHPDVCLVSCGNGYIGRDDRRLSFTSATKLSNPPFYDPLIDGMILNQGVLADRKMMLDLGGYRELVPAEDLDMCLRLAEKAPLGAIEDVLMLVRVLPGGISSSRFVQQRVYWEYVLECARRRRAAKSEPDLKDFKSNHWPEGRELRRINGQRHFRLGGAAWANRMPIRTMYHIAAAAMCNPTLILEKVKRYGGAGR